MIGIPVLDTLNPHLCRHLKLIDHPLWQQILSGQHLRLICRLLEVTKLWIHKKYRYRFYLCYASLVVIYDSQIELSEPLNFDQCQWIWLGFNPYSAGIDFIWRQILTTKVYPRTVKVKIFKIAETHNIVIPMNRKELNKTFMMISKWKNPLASQGFHTKNSALQGLN